MRNLTLLLLLKSHLALAQAALTPSYTEASHVVDILARIAHLLRDLHLCPSIEPSYLLLETRLRTLQNLPEALASDLQTHLTQAILSAIQTLQVVVACE